MKYIRVVPVLTALVAHTLTGLLCVATVGETAGCPSKEVSVLNFNTGLTTHVSGYDARRKVVPSALKIDGSDFMCLLEVWNEKDMHDIITALGPEYPSHYSVLHSAVGQLRKDTPTQSIWSRFGNYILPGRSTYPCEITDLTKIAGWAALYCSLAEDKYGCLLKKCGKYIFGVDQQCRSCLTVFSSSATALLKMCSNPRQLYNRFNTPGLMVLSKYPLRDVKYVRFLEGKADLFERGYINATQDVGDGKSVHFVCTHLTSIFPVYYEQKLPEFGSYLKQHSDEIEKLESAFLGSTHVLLGDFNTGPARNGSDGSPKLDGEYPKQYDKLMELGYENPYLENDGRCTFCTSSNGVISKEENFGDKLLDYVLTANVTSLSSSAVRTLDKASPLLSDHYGVRVDICPP